MHLFERLHLSLKIINASSQEPVVADLAYSVTLFSKNGSVASRRLGVKIVINLISWRELFVIKMIKINPKLRKSFKGHVYRRAFKSEGKIEEGKLFID